MTSDSLDLDGVRSRIEILDCIHRCARGVDRLDEAEVLSAYHPDAVDDHGTFVGSPEGFVEYFFDLHRKAHTSTSHIINNHLCELDGDTAHTETYYTFASMNAYGPPVTLASRNRRMETEDAPYRRTKARRRGGGMGMSGPLTGGR